MPIEQQDSMGSEPPKERGSVSFELVLLAPALVLLVLFVLWAGRGGRAELVADLAAGEAAVVASLCCEDDPSALDERNQVVADVLAARPGLDFLCVHGIEPANLGNTGMYVDEAWLENFEPEVEGAARGVGAIGVRFKCETDGAVAPLRGLFPNVSFYGQATEVVPIPPQPVATLSGFTATEGSDAANPKEFEFLFLLSSPSSQDVTINYNTAVDPSSGANQATEGTTGCATAPLTCDYETTSGSVTFLAGEVEKRIKVKIAGDSLYEDLATPETFVVEWQMQQPSDPCALDVPRLINPLAPFTDANNDCIPDDLDNWKAQPATGTIQDDDIRPTLSITDVSAEEGDPVTFTVSLSNPTGVAVEFTHQTKDHTTGTRQATSGASGCAYPCDYEQITTATGTLAADESSAPSTTVTVTTVNDTVGEGPETFELEVTVTNGHALPATATGTGTILDEQPQFSISDGVSSPTTEQDPPTNSTMTFTVSLDKLYTSSVMVDWATTSYGSELASYNAATEGSSCSNTPIPDYETDSGSLTFAANTMTPQTFTVTICGDLRDEPLNERFGVRLSRPPSIPIGTWNASIDDGFGLGWIQDDDPAPTVSVSVSPASVEEGDPMEFKVELSAVSENTVQVSYAVNDGTGTNPASFASGDYSVDAPYSRTGTVVFAKGIIEEIITVQALNDTYTESDETLEVTLSAPVVNATLGSPITATGTITDYRPNRITISDETALEGQNLNFTVTVTRQPGFTEEVTVDYVTADNTATGGADYTAFTTPTTVTIAANTNTATISIPALIDTANEVYDETFFVNLSNPTTTAPTAKVAISDATGVGTIQNVISRDLCVNDSSNYAVEGQALVFEVILGEYSSGKCSEKASSETVTVNWSTRDPTTGYPATAGADYVAVSNAALTFTPGQTKKTISVQTSNDQQYSEPFEKLFVDLHSTTVQNAVVRDATAEGYIRDSGRASISVADVQVTEGSDLTFTVNVANIPSSLPVTVNYTVSGVTATGPGSATGDDFDMKSPTTATGTLTVRAYQSSATVTLTTKSGDAYEPDETLRINLSNPSANAVLSDATGIGTIVQQCVDSTDSTEDPPTITQQTRALTGLPRGLRTAEEGQSVYFAVMLNAPICSSADAYFMVTAEDVTTDSADFTKPSTTLGYKVGGSHVLGSPDTACPFGVNTARQTIFCLDTVDDSVDEPDETFRFGVDWLDQGTNAMPNHYHCTPVSPRTDCYVRTNAIITDNDAMSSVRVGDSGASEGNNVVFTINLDKASGRQIVLDYTTEQITGTGRDIATEGADCTASGADYERTRGTLTFSPGDTSETVSVPSCSDSYNETPESFDFELSWPTGGTQTAILADATAVGTIADTTLPVFSIADVTVREDVGNALVSWSVDQGSSVYTSVNFETVQLSTGDYAEAGKDFTASSGITSLAPNQLAGNFPISIIDDTTAEKTEQFHFEVSNPNGLHLADYIAVVTIIDDDVDCIDPTDTTATPPTLTISDETGEESANDLLFKASLSKPFCADATVEAVTTGGTATAGVDYVAWDDDSVTVPAYYTEMEWGIQVLSDDLVEADETFNLSVEWASTMPAQYRALAAVTALGTITDDDGTLKVSVDDPVKVKEGSAVNFTVSLDKVGGRDVTVQYATSDCSISNCATAGSDYTAVSGTATIPAGDISVVIPVQTLTDTAATEADETFNFVLSSPTGAQIDDSTGVGTIENDAQPQISVSDETATEGGTLVFDVTLNKSSTAVISVDYASQDVTATAGSDYTAVSGTLVFSPGDTTKTVSVSTSLDGVSESGETFQLVLSNPVNASLDDATGVGTINNSDAPQLRVSDITATEGGTLRFEVSLDKAAAWDVVVPYTTKDGTAVQPGDYTATASTATIAVGDTTASVSVLTTDDRLDENAETMRLELSATTDAVLADPIAVGTLFDNDAMPVVSLSASKVNAYEAVGGSAGSASFTVQLSEVSGRDVQVDYATADITANAIGGSDYTATSGTLSIAAGSTTGQVSVALIDDTEVESAEAFSFTLSNPVNATLGTPATAQAVIIDDDTSEPSVLLRNHTPATEGSPATVEVYLDRQPEKVVTMYYGTSDCVGDGCATAGTDYTAASNTLITFALREQTKTISIPTTDDTDDEGNETFTVSLSGVTNANLVDQSTTLTILDDDGPPDASIGDASATEGSSLSFTVRLSFAAKQALTVDYEARADPTAGSLSATPGSDFTATSGTLTFNAGDTTKTITVPTIQDVFDEADETFWVQLTAASGATVVDGTGQGTIYDNDPLPSLSVGDATASESESATFTVTLSAASGRDVTATYTTAVHSSGANPATSGTDYTAAPGTLRIAAGNTTATFSVATLDDNKAEHDETFLVRIDNPANALVADGTGVGTIIDNDGQSRLSVADVTLFEDKGPAQFAVSLSHSSSKEITVGYRTIDGTATQPADYTFTSGTLTIAAGDNSGTISVPLVNDIAEESDETFKIELVSPTNATILDQEATATIRDDDGDPRISVGDATADEDATGGTLDFPVTLSHAADEAVTVQYSTFDRTATQPYDYTATTGTLTIPAGDTTATISVTIIDDNVAEGEKTWVPHPDCTTNCHVWGTWQNIGSETLLLRLDSPTDAIIGDGEATGTITDDEDMPRMTVYASEANEDDGHIVFTPRLSHPSVHTVSASWQIVRLQNSCEQLDINPCTDAIDDTPGEVSIAPGATTATIRVPVYDNTYTSYNPGHYKPHNNAHFDLSLIEPIDNGVKAIPFEGRGIVWDDETDPFMESLDGPDVAEDAGNAVFTMELHRITDVPVTVSYRTSTASTATAGADFTAVDSTVTFPAGTQTTTVSVPLIDDTTDESSETIVMEVYASSNNRNFALLTTGDDDQSGTVTIIDDDETPALSIGDAQASESSEEMTFLVSLDRASDQNITVDYATSDGTGSDAATAPGDYTATSGTLTFAAGDLAASFTVALEDDGVDESKEQFTVTLSNNSSGATIGDATATGWIYDGSSLPTITVSDASASEDHRTSYFRIEFDGQFSEEVNVDVSFELRAVEVASLGDRAATADIDFLTTPLLDKEALTDGWYRTTFRCSKHYVLCEENKLVRAFHFTVLYDTVPEHDEQFRVDFRNPVNIALGSTQVWGTILNDDFPIVTVDDVTVSESASSAVVTLDLHDEGVEAASVKYQTNVLTSGHTASPGDDFTGTEGTLNIAAGTTTATITVPLLGDTTDEYDEKFVLKLYDPSKLELSDAIAVITITDDDDGWHITDDSEAEGTTLSFTVTRDNAASAATLNYTIQADAGSSVTGGTHCSNGVDYITPSGTVSFAAGVATATISINTCDDTAFEGNEIFLVNLSNVTGRKTTATATITDND